LNPPSPRPLKIAIASSGLAHIRRGVETWAQDLGAALRRRGVDATTFQGSASPTGPSGTVIPCWKRNGAKAERLVQLLKPVGGWRLGFGTGYGVEQSTFALNLWPRIARHYDILHVQDPQLAQIFEYLHRAKLSRPRVILAHGTEEPADFLRKFAYLQHLAPSYLDEWELHRPSRQQVFAIPNFVDIDRFHPAASADAKAAARAAAGLPQNGLIFLCVAALKSTHKRIDYLIREFSAWRKAQGHTDRRDAVLVLVGAREPETEAIQRVAAEMDPEAIVIQVNASRDTVLNLLQAADVFAIASLHEMMPIAVLEALASGLPVACNDDPVLRWMVGDGGVLADISQPGAMAPQFSALADPQLRSRMSAAARSRAVALFSESAVVDQILAMYRQVATTA
jgi:glycosyltransferase involved in cell wall biosynthesis